MSVFVVADIGGTNTRFTLVSGKDGNKYRFENTQILNGIDFASFEEAFRHYLSGLTQKVDAACVAIAAPIDGDLVKMTNLDWSFSRREIEEKFDLSRFSVMNDFGALSVATSRLEDQDVDIIRRGKQERFANKVILGPGTGLGVAGLVYSGDKWVPIPSEGGHVNICPSTPQECELIKAAMSMHHYVSAEAFISGQGLVNIYRAHCAVEGKTAKDFSPKDISSAALDSSDKDCLATLHYFCSFLGAISSNLALSYGAHGGVYLGGGILPRMPDFLRDSQFIERFENKGVMSHYVEDIPVNLITYKETAFLGAAAWLEQILYG